MIKKLFILWLCTAFVFVGSATFTNTASAAISNPLAANGEESISVSGFTSGATLKLYLTDNTLKATQASVAGPTYTFLNVEPNSLGYYVTQTVGLEESANSPFVSASLRTPSATAGIGYVDASNVYPGATVTLYDLGGHTISSTPVDQGNGTYRFSGLTARTTYYVIQSINGVNSVNSSFVTVLPAIPDAPVAANGEESIGVSSFTSGATLKLYLTNGTLKATEPSVTAATYTFPNVEPNGPGYYVTQTVNGEESVNSNFAAASLRTPSASGGIGYIDAGNIYPGAAITLYDADGHSIPSTPADQGNGTYRFSGLTARTTYYVIQSINGVSSVNSSFATVLPAVPDAPTAANGEESISVSSFTSGATLKLYLTNGTLKATEPSVTTSTYIFPNVEPNSLGYYVTQTVNGEESVNSNFAAASLRTPAASVGIGHVDVSNVYPGAVVTLYDLGGNPLSISPADQGNGTVRFSGLAARSTYYAIQSINGVSSVNSNFVTILPAMPDAPTAANGEESISVSSFTSGATLKLYLTNGTLKATEPSVTASTYIFPNVEPNSLGYYVTQTVNGEESQNSSFVSASLRTPAASTDIGRVDVSNIYPGAHVTLYEYTGLEISSNPTAMGSGTVRFDGLAATHSYYAVQSINGVISAPTKIVTVPSLPAPVHLTAAAGSKQVTLNWSSVTGATYYSIYMDSPGGQFSLATVTNVTYTTYTIPNLINGTTYAFVVRAGNLGGLSGNSNEASATPATVPAAPADVTAVAGNGLAVITFTPPTDNGGSAITGYTVTALPGNLVISGTESPITVTGLTNGLSYTFTVTAMNGLGSSTPSAESNAVVPASRSNHGGSSSTSQPSTPTDAAEPDTTGVDILVNGKAESAGTAVTSKRNEQSVTTIIVDRAKLEEKLAAEGQHATVTIPVYSQSDVVIAELTGQMIKSMEDKQAILVLKTDQAAYTLPAQQINIASLSDKLGKSVALQDIKLQIEIAEPTAGTIQMAEHAAAKGTFTLVVPPVDFTIRAVYGGTSTEASAFSAYVERTIALPAEVDPNKITTGTVVDPDGTVRHVPTKIVAIDGKYYAKVSSLTNSTYAIVWHPLEFKDVSNHWAKNTANDMGSRMIIDGTGDSLFSPDRDITRAEFAAILVRGLGLKPENGASPFSDVNTADWYNGAIHTAYAYQLINGFEDGTFRPNDRITREQAMVIVAKAMTITNLKSKLPSQSADETLRPYTDAANASGWAKNGIADSVQSGIVAGRSGTELAAGAYITRAEVAVIIQRLLQKSDLI
ncbi:S-layer homology domain-containing protein [Paenibacillus rigui]|uniref:Uncharacterized protein n=1 Tax=Paenibacillus rigui TaxID=554312 RepID=A0A229UZ06_9BACL|nr:S-layer homology domain-containing protein [Paenibacillus rigui]OXM88365.1 hypothetical protein CF651_00430 [Paenibacillus rigui]